MIQIPKPLKKTVEHKIHGDTRTDHYFWMKERENPAVREHLVVENQYCDEVLKSVKPLEDKIFNELKARVKEDDAGYPAKQGDYYYSWRFAIGQQYPVYFRTHKSPEGPEQILIDVNELAKGESFMDCSGPRVSPNQEWMAFATDNQGRRFYTIQFKNLKTGEILPQKIANVRSSVVWAADNETIFYVQQNPETLRSEKVFRYHIPTQTTTEVYYEADETFSVSVSEGLAGQYVYISIYSTLTSEHLYVDAHQPNSKFTVFWPRERDHHYNVQESEGGFYVLSNKQAINYRLLFVPNGEVQNPAAWQTVVEHSEQSVLESVIVLKDWIALEDRTQGLVRLSYWPKANPKLQTFLQFNDPDYIVSFGEMREYNTDILRWNFQSRRQPATTFETNMRTGEKFVRKVKEVPTYNAELYVTERLWIMVRDGEMVPASIVRRKDVAVNGQAPLLMYGYGSYSHPMDAHFRPSMVSLLDRGFIFATANIRGGGELGRKWHDAGRMFNKKNTFFDFIDVTQELLKKGYGHPQKVFAMGGSAGGLLMGAVINNSNKLYKGVVAQVPFVDVMTTMLDDSLPLTTLEYDEWGNPNNKDSYDYMRSYSPYDNVIDKEFPHVLATTGFHDSQVQYWEPAKWIAKLRDHNKGKHLQLMKTDLDSGHGGASGRFDYLKEVAFEYSFILWALEN